MKAAAPATAAQGSCYKEQQLKEQQQQRTKHANAMRLMEEQRQKVKAEKDKYLANIVKPGASKLSPGMPPMFSADGKIVPTMPRRDLPPMTPPPGMPPMGGWKPPPGMPGKPLAAKAKPSQLKQGGTPPARFLKKLPGWHARSQLVPKKKARTFVPRVPAQDSWDDTEKVTLPIASCLLPVAYCLLPIAYCLYCLLSIAYCAYCLLPIAYCGRRHLMTMVSSEKLMMR